MCCMSTGEHLLYVACPRDALRAIQLAEEFMVVRHIFLSPSWSNVLRFTWKAFGYAVRMSGRVMSLRQETLVG